MKYRTVTERVGEWLGPVDWDYDFTQHDWSENRGGHNPDVTPKSVEALRVVEALVAAGKKAQVRLYGEWRDVIRIGMYDGWPFWAPTPSYSVSSWMGPEGHSFLSVSVAREGESQ